MERDLPVRQGRHRQQGSGGIAGHTQSLQSPRMIVAQRHASEEKCAAEKGPDPREGMTPNLAATRRGKGGAAATRRAASAAAAIETQGKCKRHSRRICEP